MATVKQHTATVKRVSVELSLAEAKALVEMLYEIASPSDLATQVCAGIAGGFGYNLHSLHSLSAVGIKDAEEATA